ncbi:hypothetical protein D9M68_525430 [compost metagenome]
MCEYVVEIGIDPLGINRRDPVWRSASRENSIKDLMNQAAKVVNIPLLSGRLLIKIFLWRFYAREELIPGVTKRRCLRVSGCHEMRQLDL